MELINGDCNVELQKLIDKNVSVDSVITDPPYNISRETNFESMGSRGGQGMDFGEWDKDADILSYIDLLPDLLNENANIVIFNDWKKLTDICNRMQVNNITPKRCLVLDKSNPVPFNRDRLFVNDVEFAVWGVYNSKNKPEKWTFNRQADNFEKCVMPTTLQNSKLHPTMKDLKVIERLVLILTNESDIVLDPFMGSGTTGVACMNHKRDFIGVEIDEKYFETANKRIDKNQTKLI